MEQLQVSPEAQRLIVACFSGEFLELQKLLPCIMEQLQDSRFDNLTIDDLRSTVADNGNTVWQNLIDAARQNADITKVTLKQLDNVDCPLDKVNSKVWSKVPLKDLIPIAAENQLHKTRKKQKEINIWYSIDFDNSDNINIHTELNIFDKYVYMAVANLYNAGNSYVTPTSIYHAMGGVNTPGKKQQDAILESVRKMMSARITLDNTEEAAAYNYVTNHIDDVLLPCRIKKIEVNGKLTSSGIYLRGEPPLMEWARERNQITTFPLAVLQTPINRTDDNLILADYLRQRIARIKNSTGNNVILISTILKQLKIDTLTPTNQKNIKKRLPEKLQKLFDYWQSINHIKGYTLTKDRITIAI